MSHSSGWAPGNLSARRGRRGARWPRPRENATWPLCARSRLLLSARLAGTRRWPTAWSAAASRGSHEGDPYTELERLWRRDDIAVREKALWRLLYESAARAQELLSLNAEDV